ncbi:class I SAM-dependent methyltransferase [Pedobacter sp. Du54]|uniref:class I SAM-dependent methyltransferase n=1 Tax=Pedobacter anseongensis TaxID=3133439 RepID=UPI0030B42167
MKGKENLPIFTHNHPHWLLKNPNLLSVLHLVPYLFQLRKWYVTRHLSKLLKALPKNFKLIDVGCGEGQFLFQFAKLYPNSRFLGVDKNESNVHLCRLYANAKDFKGVRIEQASIESMNVANAYDVAICIGVLQYVQDDKKAIECIYKALSPGGKLFLYTPINNRVILPYYKKIIATYVNYETVQDRKRIYSEKTLLGLGKDAGFSIHEHIVTYGFWGNLSNELTNLCLLFVAHLWFPINIMAGLVFLLLYPFILLCMFLDFMFPVRKGNGLLLVFHKGD